MGYRSPVTDRIGAMITGEAADPRAPQTAFLVPAVALLSLLIGFTPGQARDLLVISGIALIALATLATFTVPWPRLPPLAIVSIPLLDLVAIGLLRLNPQVGAVGVLVVFPAMWLGTVFRWRGVVFVTLASIAVLTVPGFMYFGTSLEGWSRAVILPIVTFVTAYSMYVTAEAWSKQRAELEHQGALLERALEDATEQRRLNEAIVQTVDVGLVALDAHGIYDSMNPRHREFMGIGYPDGHDGAAGQPGYAYASDKETPLGYDEMPTVRAVRGVPFSDYTIWVGKEVSERRALSVSARPFFDENGEFDGAVLAYQDITDLMQALRAKDEFVASVSHELRTPLTSIIGYLDLTSEYEDELPAEVNRNLDVVARNAERLLLLVSDLLTTVQSEAGTVQLSVQPTDLAELVQLSIDAAGPRLHDAQVRVSANLLPLPPVSVDPGHFAQVVENLLSNSIKYTPGGGTIEIGLEQAGREVLLIVRDDGIGISAEDQEQMFTRFFRASTAMERAIPGVGLGLVITKAIVEGHGGTVEVFSEEGVGTTVRVRLPLEPLEAHVVDPPSAVPAGADWPLSAGHA